MDERELLNAWRQLFRDPGTTTDKLASAEALLSKLTGESPLRLRLAKELAELTGTSPNPKKKRASARRNAR